MSSALERINILAWFILAASLVSMVFNFSRLS